MPFYVTTAAPGNAVPLTVLRKADYAAWHDAQPASARRWLEESGFTGAVGKHALLADGEGQVTEAVAVIGDEPDIWSLAHLPAVLPVRHYRYAGPEQDGLLQDMALGWQLATYRFTRFKEAKEKGFAALVVPESVDIAAVEAMATGICLARELVNRPANDLTPLALAEAAQELAQDHGAECSVVRGDALLEENYPLVHAVGRASANAPCLVDMRWGAPDAPKVTLVGKGVCFDSGGLDIKPSSGMLLMKKDMGGAASVLALAHAVMAAELPVRLRVLIPAAENSVSSNAFRPKDIIRSRKGLTVEIGNTDAEGRLVLCDALTEADSESPDLLVDFATLTGAARIALGTDVPAFFTRDDEVAEALQQASRRTADPLWRLPLWQGYRDMLDSDVADICNATDSGYGGAITAALYLDAFVEATPRYVHIDLMAWNTKNRPGRPQGGEAMGVRAVFSMLRERYAVR